MTLRVTTLTTMAEVDAIVLDWERLAQAQPVLLPFHRPQWHRIWWKHLAANLPWVKDHLRVMVAREASSQQLVGVAPFMLTERPARGPFRVRCLQFFGADPNITEMRGPLVLPERAPAVFEAWNRHLNETRKEWDWVLWSGLTGEQSEIFSRSLCKPVTPASPAYLLDLKPTWQELKSGLKHNVKESLRKCYNSLKRDGHEFQFEVVRPGSGSARAMAVALENFFHLHRARAGVGGTVAHKNVFESAAARAFLTEYCERPDSNAVVFTLRIREQVVASRIAFVLGDTLYFYFSGFDPQWGKYSVMTTAVAEAIQWSIAQGLKVVNFSFGTDVSKTRWGPREVPFFAASFDSPRLHSRLTHQSYDWLVNARQYPVIQKVLSFAMRGSRLV